MPFTVILSNRALRDLEVAREYLRSVAPDIAERWYRTLLDALRQLEGDPLSWPLAPESEKFPFELRQFLFRTKSRRANRALFMVVGNEVRILAIRRPGQPLVTKRDVT